MTERVDASRPAGRSAGDGRRVNPEVGRGREHTHTLHSGGIAYRVSEQIRGHFSLPMPKSKAYAWALRSLMVDVVAAIRSPDHRLRAGLPEGERSLNIALAATERGVGRLTGSQQQ